MFWSLIFLASSAPGTPDISEDVEQLVQKKDDLTGEELLSRLEKLSATGDDSATLLLGESLFGLGINNVEPDEKRACGIFKELRLKYGEAAHNYATCFYRKTSPLHDYKQARLEYLSAINLGWRDSSCALGNMLIRGQGGPKDVEKGMQLCLDAAEKGVAHAQTDYGIYLLLGKHVPKDAKQARMWFERAAEQKHANASYLLAQIYQRGDGTPKNTDAAEKWFKVSYDAGRPDAAYQLGLLNLAKLLVQKDGETRFYPDKFDETAKWLMIAQQQDPSVERRKSASELFTAIETLKAKYTK